MLYGRSLDGNRELGRGGRVRNHRVLAELGDRKGDGFVQGFGLDMSAAADAFRVLERNEAMRNRHAEHYSAIFAFCSP